MISMSGVKVNFVEGRSLDVDVTAGWLSADIRIVCFCEKEYFYPVFNVVFVLLADVTSTHSFYKHKTVTAMVMKTVHAWVMEIKFVLGSSHLDQLHCLNHQIDMTMGVSKVSTLNLVRVNFYIKSQYEKTNQTNHLWEKTTLAYF